MFFVQRSLDATGVTVALAYLASERRNGRVIGDPAIKIVTRRDHTRHVVDRSLNCAQRAYDHDANSATWWPTTRKPL